MSAVDQPDRNLVVAADTLTTDDETASLFTQIGNDAPFKRLTEFNQIVAASLVGLCAASPYMASVLLKISEEDAHRLANLTPLQVYELANASSFLVVASPVLPKLVNELHDGRVDAGPALFAYITQGGRNDVGS